MNKAELAEIRALLQATAPVERRPKPALFGALRAILPVRRDVESARPSPRRVGLRSAETEGGAEAEALLLEQPAEDDGPRHAFGQRRETMIEPAPLLRLAGPGASAAPLEPFVDTDVAEVLRRRSLRLAPVPAPAETPFHPEDLSDPVGHDAEQLYLDAGLFAAPAETLTQETLLQRLEQVFLSERAALQVREAS